TFLSDNLEGRCNLTTVRMEKLIKRDQRNISATIAKLEEEGLIGVHRESGLPNFYWPVVPAALVDANPISLINALSPKPTSQRQEAVLTVTAEAITATPGVDVGGVYPTPPVTPDVNVGGSEGRPPTWSAGTPDVEPHSISLRELTNEKDRGAEC